MILLLGARRRGARSSFSCAAAAAAAEKHAYAMKIVQIPGDIPLFSRKASFICTGSDEEKEKKNEKEREIAHLGGSRIRLASSSRSYPGPNVGASSVVLCNDLLGFVLQRSAQR